MSECLTPHVFMVTEGPDVGPGLFPPAWTKISKPTLLEDLFRFLNLLCLVVRTESEGGGRELGVRASVDQDHHLPWQEPGEARQEHQLQEQSLGRGQRSNCTVNCGLRNKQSYQQSNYKGNLENFVQADLHAFIEPSRYVIWFRRSTKNTFKSNLSSRLSVLIVSTIYSSQFLSSLPRLD